MRIRAVVLGICIAFAQVSLAWAIDYPTRLVRIVVAYPAGGGADILVRSIAAKLQLLWGKTVIIENKPGAGTTFGTASVAKAAPDGYTILLTDISFAIAASYYDKLPYDSRADFVPIGQIATASHVLAASKDVKINSVRELIEFAKANPKQLLFATSGPGTIDYLCWALLDKMTGNQTVAVPYKGATPAVIDLVSGRIAVWSGSAGALMTYFQNGDIRPLVVYEDKRAAGLPDVPTIVEAGYPSLLMNAWYGLFAPAGTPKEIAEKIYADFAKVIDDPDIRKTYDLLSDDVVTTVGPDAFKKLVDSDIDKWRVAVEAAGES